MAVRISRINRRTSRLVIDLFPTVKINTRRLRLNNFSRNRWKLILAGLPMRKFNTLKGLSIKWNPPLVDLQPKIKKKKQIIIDPGHGGQDPGAIGLNDLRETDVVLSLCLRVAALLQAQGFQTVLTRSSETSVDLFRRASVANNLEANLFVSIHANAVSSVRGDINGIETFYCEDGLSFRLAKEIQQFILKASPKSISRGVRNGHFFVIRNTLMSSVLVETGFLTGSLDSIRLATYEYRERVALAIATGILNYIKKES